MHPDFNSSVLIQVQLIYYLIFLYPVQITQIYPCYILFILV